MYLQHFDSLSSDQLDQLFEVRPGPIPLDSVTGELGQALGATLYLPGDRPCLVDDVLSRRRNGAQCLVMDLEDAVRPECRPEAEAAVIAALARLSAEAADEPGSERALPAVFVRVADADGMLRIAQALGRAGCADLTGFVLPKFEAGESGEAAFAAVAGAEEAAEKRFFVMPVIEAVSVAHRETRSAQLLAIRRLLDEHRESVLCVRIGATDLASAFGLRRDGESTIYDVRVVADAIGDIVNVFARERPWAYPVSGAVWEHFSKRSRLQKPRLRESPFLERDAPQYRRALLDKCLDGLINEIELDKINGLSGKTVIHPSHVSVVHALSAVRHEEFCDAVAVSAARDRGGVLRSAADNKMNEVRPHTAWADRVLLRAAAFGVLRPDLGFVDLMMQLDRISR
ncbi:HpcH/HpaI aldolase/citrate lyase family protein [Rathayibacter sp. AY1H3]|jgi:citrate lyase beta subunit|uniref:HpcH/HpaI aldolase/citrate lyase family protein n=1 Tax=Rathayibacter sp. AY1H3 TaxID=2080567 RepID=UPI000CE7F339|nr:HpcH/HpaI aldolase/citrate lyase family protein [Rathayibacter sp. AY1H3]PPH07757.1 ATP/GTP-binding protein [Rathayibacter sp. AY1H3]